MNFDFETEYGLNATQSEHVFPLGYTQEQLREQKIGIAMRKSASDLVHNGTINETN